MYFWIFWPAGGLPLAPKARNLLTTLGIYWWFPTRATFQEFPLSCLECFQNALKDVTHKFDWMLHSSCDRVLDGFIMDWVEWWKGWFGSKPWIRGRSRQKAQQHLQKGPIWGPILDNSRQGPFQEFPLSCPKCFQNALKDVAHKFDWMLHRSCHRVLDGFIMDS